MNEVEGYEYKNMLPALTSYNSETFDHDERVSTAFMYHLNLWLTGR